MTKQQRYLQMVSARKACRACEGLTNQSAVDGGRFDSDEVGSWALWQGNLDADIMVVGQDWGDVAWFRRAEGCPTNTSVTNRTLIKLLSSLGPRFALPKDTPGRGVAFFTNAILCLKEGGAQAPVRDEWFRECGTRFLKPLIDLVQPKAVICLGARAYRSVLHAHQIRPQKFRAAVEGDPIVLDQGTLVFAVYHCGAGTLNRNRDLPTQERDWARIKAKLRGRLTRGCS